MMHKKLRQMGSSWGFIIPKPLLECLRVTSLVDVVHCVRVAPGLTFCTLAKKLLSIVSERVTPCTFLHSKLDF